MLETVAISPAAATASFAVMALISGSALMRLIEVPQKLAPVALIILPRVFAVEDQRNRERTPRIYAFADRGAGGDAGLRRRRCRSCGCKQTRSDPKDNDLEKIRQFRDSPAAGARARKGGRAFHGRPSSSRPKSMFRVRPSTPSSLANQRNPIPAASARASSETEPSEGHSPTGVRPNTRSW